MNRTIPRATLETANGKNLRGYIIGGLSILKSIGANKLRLQMAIVGKLCQLIVWLIFAGKTGAKTNRRTRAANLVKFFFPTTIVQNSYRPTNENASKVPYFNHQSLFEVLAVIWYHLKFSSMREQCLFPVNLPWFEALTPSIERLRVLGIHLTPLITPSTYNKLRKISAENLQIVNRIKILFEKEYFNQIAEFLKAGHTVAVAPSATRTMYIFPDKTAYDGTNKVALKSMPRTMTAILFALRHAEINDRPIDFFPFVATRKRRAGTGLNIWRHHDVYIGAHNTLEEMRNQMKDGALDYNCYHRLAHFVPEHVKYPC